METMDNKKVWILEGESGQHRGKEIARNAYISDLTPQEVYTIYCNEDGINFWSLSDFDGFDTQDFEDYPKRYEIFKQLEKDRNIQFIVASPHPSSEILEILCYDDVYTSVSHNCERLYLAEIDEEGEVIREVDGKHLKFDW